MYICVMDFSRPFLAIWFSDFEHNVTSDAKEVNTQFHRLLLNVDKTWCVLHKNMENRDRSYITY